MVWFVVGDAGLLTQNNNGGLMSGGMLIYMG